MSAAKNKNNNQSTLDTKLKDIVILVMGPTGSGKSTFINRLLGKKTMEVSDRMTSCTHDLQVEYISPPDSNFQGSRLAIVDTPGFDDTTKDADVLLRVARWLKQAHRQNMVLGGVLYLHDISNDRFSATAVRNLEIFLHMCRHAALNTVVLGTTKWGRIPHDIGVRHEEELRDGHWKSLINKGSTLLRHEDSKESAWSLINVILEKELRVNDIVILVIGASGAGKSTFINDLLQKARMPVGTHLTGYNTSIDYEIIKLDPSVPRLKDRRLVIVDTPGFDTARTSLSDISVLQKIVDWIERHCHKKIKLCGIIYLHDISLSGYSPIAKYYLTFLRASFGRSNEAFQRVIFATTKWDRVDPAEGCTREIELESIWEDFTKQGSEIRRLQSGDDAARCAWDIIDVLLSRAADDDGFYIVDPLKELQTELQSNTGEKVIKEVFSSILQPLLGLLYNLFRPSVLNAQRGKVSNKAPLTIVNN